MVLTKKINKIKEQYQKLKSLSFLLFIKDIPSDNSEEIKANIENANLIPTLFKIKVQQL